MKPKSREKSKEQAQSAPKKDELQQLRQQVEDLTKEKNEIFEKLQRVAADYENFQKRVPKQIADTITYEKEKIIKTILPALDNFEHTLQNAHSAENPDVLIKGINIIYDQMLDILKAHGVEQIKATGQKFDPALHEAMMQKTEADQQDDIVLEEFQKGYKLNGRVIRPSKVIVNKLQPEQNQQEKKPDLDELADDETVDTE
jgi:molecular chaperone GrpE